MKRRWNATSLLLVALALLIVGVGIDLARHYLLTEAAEAPTPAFSNGPSAPPRGRKLFVPDFAVGDQAPDFTLNDHNGIPHRLSDLARGDTLLCFICGCNNCLDLQTYIGIIRRRIGPGAPKVVTVATMPRERNATWIRDSKLPQTILYEKKEGPVEQLYRGEPCPRVYHLKPGMKVAWIGPSPKDMPQLEMIGAAVNGELGNPNETTLPKAPR